MIERSFLVILLLFFIVSPVSAGTETLISVNTSSSSQYDPVIFGNWIVWTDGRLGTSQVYGYNVESGEEARISPPGSTAIQPSIYEDRIVWSDHRNGNYDIYLFNMTLGIESRIISESHDQQLPVIYGNRVAWQDNRAGTSDIYLYDTTTTGETVLTPDTADTDQVNPDIYGSRIVWQDRRNYNDLLGDFFNDIFMRDITTGELLNVSQGVSDSDEYNPAISGNTVIWGDERNGQKADIYMNNTVTGSQDPVNDNIAAFRILPAIDGSNVIWLDNRNRVGENYDLYHRDILAVPGSDTRITGPVSKIVYSGKGPKISGNRIVWTDQRNGNNDIFMYTLGADQTCPVANFAVSPSQSGAIPFTVQFTDTSSAGTTAVSHQRWEFGDGNTSSEENPQFTYRVSGNFNVRLTIDNPYCRNETPILDIYRVSAGAAPVAGFAPNVTSGMVPLPVKFTDSSAGATSWNWSFGDGFYSVLQNPAHSYGNGGTYTVTLNASNTYGFTTKQAIIQALTGADKNADLTIDGVAITSPYGTQFLTYDTVKLPGPVNAGTTLISTSPQLAAHGLVNITFLSLDSLGFRNDGTLIKGNISGVTIWTEDIRPTGFSKAVGDSVSINYSISAPTYPVGGTLNTRVWEGSTASDYSAFETIAHSSGYSEIWGIAYTTQITKTNFPACSTAQLYMNVNSSWIAGLNGRAHTLVERISDERSNGEVLPAQFLSADPPGGYDKLLIDSPHGSSTFALAQLAGSGNPFQLITLSILGQLDPGSFLSGSSDTGSAASSVPSGSPAYGAGKAEQSVPAGQMKAPQAPDPGKSEKVFTGRDGMTTQPLTLVSMDRLASISLDKGVTARDATGKSIDAITIAAVPAESVASSAAGQVFSFAGMAYDIQPDGAIFSRALSISFTVPQAVWGQNYAIMRYDRPTGRWQEIPSVFDASTGSITGQADHLCMFALFTKPISRETPVTMAPLTPAPRQKAPVDEPPSTAVSMFMNMLSWAYEAVLNNIMIVCGVGAAAACIVFYWVRVR